MPEKLTRRARLRYFGTAMKDAPHSDLCWERSQQEGAEIFRVTGSFCLLCPDKLDQFRDAARSVDAPRCVLDLREVGYMDSAGLGVVALMARHAAANSTTLVVIPSTPVRRLMATTGIERALLVADSIHAALEVKPSG
jgi:anti-anti-sigma factor